MSCIEFLCLEERSLCSAVWVWTLKTELREWRYSELVVFVVWKRNAATSQTASLRTTLCASATIRQRRISFYSTSLPPLQLQLSTQSTHTRASKSLLCVAHLLSWHKDIQYVFVAENNCFEISRIVVGVGNIISTIIPPSLICCSLRGRQGRTTLKVR